MLVITEVCTAYGSLGHAVIELNDRETEAYLKWLDYLEDKKVQQTREAIAQTVSEGVE